MTGKGHHSVIMDLITGSKTFKCHAPKQSLCHADWACGCETWQDAGIEGNRAWHVAYDPDSGEEVNHWASFRQECNLRDWFDADDEPLHGSVTFRVDARFETEWYEFDPVAGTAEVTP